MKFIIKRLFTLFTAITLAGCLLFISACTAEAETGKDGAKASPFAFKSNVINPEAKIDGVMDDDIWRDENRVEIEYSSAHVTLVLRPNALYLFYKVYDVTPFNYVNTGDADEVTKSDSIEFYVDSKLNRASAPVGNCYQINLGRDGRTRIMSGSGGLFYNWLAQYVFEVKEGDTADDYDYYYVEVMLPVGQMKMTGSDCVGVAFGVVDRHIDSNVDLNRNYTWTGYEYTSFGSVKFVDPMVPKTYLVLSPVSLIKGQSNRLYTFDEYSALTTGK